jgi:hypothetical protein
MERRTQNSLSGQFDNIFHLNQIQVMYNGEGTPDFLCGPIATHYPFRGQDRFS